MLENQKKPDPRTPANFAAIVEAAETSATKACDGPRVVVQIVKMMTTLDIYKTEETTEFIAAMEELIEAHEKAKQRFRALTIKMALAK